MNLSTSKLLNEIDQLKPERYPLPAHFAMKADSHAREIYAVFLAGVLLSGAHISDNQSRLFQMLLTSLSLENSQASLYERAKEIDQDLLREFFRITDEHDLAQSFIVDAAVLCRIEHELMEPQVILFSEIADSLKLSMHQMGELMALVAIILGFPSDKEFKIDYDYSRFSVWDEFTYKTLTAEKLQNGFISGRWSLDHKIEINSPLVIDCVTLRFIKDGEINARCSGDFIIKNVELINPVMTFSGALKLYFSKSIVTGKYAKEEKKTAINIHSVSEVLIRDVDFSTINSRSILVNNTKASIDNCKFDECGNELLIGGAIAAKGCEKNPISIKETRFINCESRLGKAIRVDFMGEYFLDGCYFEQDEMKLKNQGFSNSPVSFFYSSSIFSDLSVLSKIAISECEFRNSSIRVGGVPCSGSYGLFWVGRLSSKFNKIKLKNSFFVFGDVVSEYDGNFDISYSDSKEGNVYQYNEEPKEWWGEYE